MELKYKLATPLAILIGSILISLAILVSGGIVKIGKSGTSAPTPPANPNAAKTEAQIVDKLKDYAGKLSLNAGKFNNCLDQGAKANLVTTDLNDGTSAGVTGTPAFYINGKFLGGAFPYQAFKEIIDKELNGTGSTNYKDYSSDLQQAHDDPRGKYFDPVVKNVDLGNLPPLGSQNAPVTIIEFSDYQCPFCERHFVQAETQIKKDYINTGKVKLYYRDFPLSQIHVGARKGAEAARCAGEQGKYWDYHDLIFQNQSDIF